VALITPLDSNKIVFNNGIAKGLTVSIPKGGQEPPISIVGANAEWKKLQNTLAKAITSEITKRMNPIDKPD
jgi:hypothetical protein